MDYELQTRIKYVLSRISDLAVKPDGWTDKEWKRSLEHAGVWAAQVKEDIEAQQGAK